MPGVLIADDNHFIREQLGEFLLSKAIEVCGAAIDGVQAIELVRELNPSLIVLDVYMPHVNGVAAAYEIRRIAPRTKIIFFTNYSVPRNTGAWRVLGCDAFVSKASGIAELLATILRFLPGGEMNPGAETFYMPPCQ